MPVTRISDTQTTLLSKWALLTFVWFIIAGGMGAFLRLHFFYPVQEINYRNFLHGHSHLAFLGWVFNALYVALLYAYLPAQAKRYQILFWLLQVSVLGMLISFPIQGYAAVSITFSTLHIFLSYAFAYRFLMDVHKEVHLQEKHALSLSFTKWSLFFMVLSSIGPFALGVVMAKGLSGTSLYQLAIYFYLHFQYDGWFTFAVFGLFFWLLENNNIEFDRNKGSYFLWLMAVACMPAYALSALWTHPPVWVYSIATLAAILQITGLILLISFIYPLRKSLITLLKKEVFYLFVFAGIAFCIKISLQLVSSLPAVADLAYMVRNFTIGYLHLVFLGFITIFLMGWYGATGFFNLRPKAAKTGILLLISGFICSQFYLIAQPLLFKYQIGAIPFYYQSLFIFSLLIPLGTALLLASRILVKREAQMPVR